MTTQIVAVDWSGRARNESEFIWIARVRDGELVELDNGRSREATIEHLVGIAERQETTVIGLDFAFSFPAWYLDARGWKTARDGWRALDAEATTILRDCPEPFWGRPQRRNLHGREPLRLTEREIAATPKSVFQIGGAGAVGTGSLRGMPHLAALESVGFCIWPFDGEGWPRVVEIYPRVLTGPIVKARETDRRTYLAERTADQPQTLMKRAARSADAFDAAVSALVMARHVDELEALEQVPRGSIYRREGRIWTPINPAQARDSGSSSSRDR